MQLTRWLFLPLALSFAIAQDPPSDNVIRINVNVVQVDAVVTDSKGNHVRDLTKDDFVVLQDGKPQTITYFNYVATRDAGSHTLKAVEKGMPAPPPTPVSSAIKAGNVRRTIAIVVDDLGLSWASIVRIRQSARKWVDNEMQPGDLVAVIRTSAGMGALQQFTGDKRLLYQAIDKLRYNSLGRVGVSSFEPLQGATADTAAADANARFEEERDRVYSLGTVGAIRYVVEGMREVPGRKSLVLFSESMKSMLREGQGTEIIDALQRLTDAANRSSVVVYAVDPRGLQYYGLSAADNTAGMKPAQIAAIPAQRSQQVWDSQEGMVMLARNTGGLFLQNTNDIDGALRKVVDDGDGYYLIGYHPDASTFDQKTGRPHFHNMQVKVKRAGLTVRSRKGFIGQSDRPVTAVAHTRQAEIQHALFSPFSTGALHVQLTTIYTQGKEGAYINALLHFDPKELKFTDEPDDYHKAVVDTVAITFGSEGQQVDATDKQWTMRVKGKTYEDMLRKGVVYSVHVAVNKPGAYQMRTVLRDAQSEQVGSATQFIEVPDVSKGRLTLSGIVLAADHSAQNKGDAVGHAEGQVEDEDPNGTAAVRIFKPGAAMAYGYQILNAQAGEDRKPQLEVQTRLFRDGEVVYTGKPAPMAVAAGADPKRLVGGGRMQLGRIAPGDYVLQVIVRDKLAKGKDQLAAGSMDFRIE